MKHLAKSAYTFLTNNWGALVFANLMMLAIEIVFPSSSAQAALVHIGIMNFAFVVLFFRPWKKAAPSE